MEDNLGLYYDGVQVSYDAGRLSDWESDFFENIMQKLDDGVELSDKQFNVLEKLYYKY